MNEGEVHEVELNARKYYKVFDKKKDLRKYLLSKGDGKKGRK